MLFVSLSHQSSGSFLITFYDGERPYLSCWCSRPSCLRRLFRSPARLLCCPHDRCRCLWFPRKRLGCWADCCCSAVVPGDGPPCAWRASWPALGPRLWGTHLPSHPEQSQYNSGCGYRDAFFIPIEGCGSAVYM